MNNKITIPDTLNKLDNLPKPENMSDSDKKFYSSIGAALFENELEQLILNKEWMVGIIVMGSMLDFVGKTKLIWHHKGKISTNSILNYKFSKTIKELEKNNIINIATLTKLEEIRKVRNSFAHDLLRQWTGSQKPNLKIETLIRDGIALINKIF